MARDYPNHKQANRHHIARAIAVGKHIGLSAKATARARRCPEAGAAAVAGMADPSIGDAWLNDCVGRPTMRDFSHV